MVGRFPPTFTLAVIALVGALAGAAWVGLAGGLRHFRGVNETTSSLQLTYIAIAIMNFFCEDLLRDPGTPNKPSTLPIGEAYMRGRISGTDTHWGLPLTGQCSCC